MNILKLAIKSVVSFYLAVRIFKPDVLLDTIVTFALLYGLVTYYIEYFPYYVSSDYIEDYIYGIFVLLLLPLIGVGIGSTAGQAGTVHLFCSYPDLFF